MNLRLVVCQLPKTSRRIATIIQERDFSTNSIPTSYGEVIFIASVKCSGDIEFNMRAILKMWGSETKRPGKKIKVQWIDSGTINVEVLC